MNSAATPFQEEEKRAFNIDPLATHKVLLKQPGAVHVTECGHRFDPRNEPRHNCVPCWNVYFQFHPVEVEAARSAMKVYGEQKVTNKRGARYVKWVKKFIQFLEQWEAQEALMTQSSSGPSTEATARNEESSVSSTTPQTESSPLATTPAPLPTVTA